MSAEEILARNFATLPEVIREYGRERAAHPALIEGERRLSYAELDALMDRIASALQRDGIGLGEPVAICATSSIEYAATFAGILRAGGAVVPLMPSATPESLAKMLEDCEAKVLLYDQAVARALSPLAARLPRSRVALDGGAVGEPFESWLAPPGARPAEVAITPEHPFNILYSSGTTGVPKGIVQPHSMRWGHITRGAYPAEAVTLISTPLYSNTTLVSFLPTLSNGATVVLMPKFDAGEFLKLSQKHRVTHAMLVPVQYRRLMQHPDFDRYDLSSYQMKYATSAPFSAELKAQVLRRWPGGLVEFYGMTEGGASCMLAAHEFPGKLHTVGQPMPGHEIRLIDEQGREVPPGEIGEIVGHSPAMMTGYLNQPGKTRESEWLSPQSVRYIRTGDIGRFDEDGFLILMDRKKDMIISGGLNVYPSDLEAVIVKQPAVLEAAVVGVPSERWGETPVAFVVLKPGSEAAPESLLERVNAALGKAQRLAGLRLIDALPRSHIGKVDKRALRERYGAETQAIQPAAQGGKVQ